MSLDQIFFSHRPAPSRNDRLIDEDIADIDDSDFEAKYRTLRREHERLELVVEALVWYLQEKVGLERDLLRVMAQRIDLADGVEDGRVGPDRAKQVPECSECHNPINPKRKACLYCGSKKKPKPVRTARSTTCVTCRNRMLESNAFITMQGLLCGKCFDRKEAGVGGGQLSVAEGTSGALSNVDGESGALSDPTE